MRQKLSNLKTVIVVLMPAIVLLLAGCGSNKTDKVNVDLSNQDPSVVLPPGYPAVMNGSTLVIQGFSGSPMVHSFPQFAGVDTVGDIGIGSAAGYDPGDSLVLPVNANLGTQQLNSYKVCITMDSAQYLQLTGVLGSDYQLAETYPKQYTRAEGFEGAPTQVAGNPLCVLATSSGSAATSRVNLAELKFIITQQLPPSGVHLTFQVMELKDGMGNDICPNFVAGDCSPLSGIVVNNFYIQKP